jgi:porphobilinogen deaminase
MFGSGGALATCRDGVLSVNAQVTSLDGCSRVAGGLTVSGPEPEAVGASLALTLRERGADAILDQIREPASR